MQKILFHPQFSVLCLNKLLAHKSDGEPPVGWVMSSLNQFAGCWRSALLEDLVRHNNLTQHSFYLVWIAKPFTTNVLQHFHQKIMTTYITYLTANDYYMPTYCRDRKTCKPTTEAANWDPMITSTNEFQQVMPFPLFHCASNAPQTKKRRALSVILTHRNKTEMAYQVMRENRRQWIPP
jgi:hypothetical protein